MASSQTGSFFSRLNFNQNQNMIKGKQPSYQSLIGAGLDANYKSNLLNTKKPPSYLDDQVNREIKQSGTFEYKQSQILPVIDKMSSMGNNNAALGSDSNPHSMYKGGSEPHHLQDRASAHIQYDSSQWTTS